MMFQKLLQLIICFISLSVYSQNRKTLLFIGTYTQGMPDSGIYVCNFNSKTGEINLISTGHQLTNPSYLNLSPNGCYIYACTHSKLPIHGRVAAFGIDSINSKVSIINSQSSLGENPVYLSAHPTKNFVVNVNYTQGNLSVYKTLDNGSLSQPIQAIQFKDSSIIKSRQEKSHLHAAVFSPDGNYVLFPDLGADKLRVFEFEAQKEKPLTEKKEIKVKCVPGSGPRHLIFHPNGKYVYTIEELSGTISVYTFKNGKLDSVQRVFSYSKQLNDYAGADIHVSPDGLFLYASNRIENTISVFSINTTTGLLKLTGHHSTYGDHPRNFTIDPGGNFLLVANLNSNTIIVFKRDLKTGLLTKTKHELNIPKPSCLKMRIYSN